MDIPSFYTKFQSITKESLDVSFIIFFESYSVYKEKRTLKNYYGVLPKAIGFNLVTIHTLHYRI